MEIRSDRETQIFDGVLRLAAGGSDLGQLKVQEIADAAGMGKGTLYEYFRSKEEILLGTFFYCIQRELTALEQLLEACHDFDALLEKSLDYVSDLIDSRASSYRLIALALNPGEQQDRCRGFLPEYGGRLRTLLQRAMALGKQSRSVRQDCEYSYFAYVISSAYMSFANALMHQKSEVPPEFSFLCDKGKLRAYTRSMLKRALA